MEQRLKGLQETDEQAATEAGQKSPRSAWWRQSGEVQPEAKSTPSTAQTRPRVSWWQQGETTEVQPVAPLVVSSVQEGGVVVTTAPAEALDIGEELELEAKRRAVAEARGERVVIYANGKQNTERLRKRLLWVGIPFSLLYGILAVMEPAQFAAIWLFLVVEYVAIYHVMKRLFARQTHPAVVLTDAGIEIHTIGHDIGLVRWGEIAEVRAYNLMYRYVGITPRDTGALCARLSKRQAWLIRANEWCVPLYRLFRQHVAVINLAQQNLPLSADALVAKIEAFRAARGV